MKDTSNFTHYAKYPLFGFFVPCLYNEQTENIEGQNWLYDQLLTLAVWIDFEWSEGFGYFLGKKIEQ